MSIQSQVTNYTALLALKPRSQNLLEELGLFTEENTDYLTGENAEFEREVKGLTKMYNVSRGADRQFAGSEGSEYQILKVPFATLDGVTKPHEVQGFREYGTENTPASIKVAVEKKIAHIQRSHQRYVRDAQYSALVDNKVYAFDSNGTELTSLAKNFSTLWGAARNTGAINYSATTVDPFDALEAARNNVTAKAGDDADGYDIIYICSSKEFSALVSHPKVQAAYDSYASSQEPLRLRLNGNKNNRMFSHKGVTVWEDISGKVADTKGFVVPTGIADMFGAAYAPADLVSEVNEIAQSGYLFMVENHRSVVVESEVAYMAMITRPELITDITVSYA